jgi:prepilin-type N-terminal cleavage/methylation domain-containing protein
MKKGFTLIELVLVITILAVLAISALPKFIDVSRKAETASIAGVIGAVRAGIALYRANDLVANGAPGNYPATLDANAVGSCTTCFSTVLTQPVSETKWKSTTVGLAYTYDSATDCLYTYTPAAGTFSMAAGGAADCPN